MLSISARISEVLAAIFAPVIGIAFAPRELGPYLVVLVIRVALALGLLPAPPTLTLTRGCRAVALLWNLRVRPEYSAACCTSNTFHETLSALDQCAKRASTRQMITCGVNYYKVSSQKC